MLATHSFLRDPVSAQDRAPRDRKELEAFMGLLASSDIPRDRPLWQLIVIPSYEVRA